MKAALYARVSTHAGQNPEMQLAELRAYCQRRGWEIAGEYMDVGISGAKERRPELDRLLAECRRRRMDAVVVYRYDRFARSLRQLVNALCDFDALGIQFVSLHEGVDTSTPNGRLVFGIFASIAEFERELIRERVRSGMAAARARGARIGRPRKPVDAEKVVELRARRASWRTIARELGVGMEQFAGWHRNIPEKIQWLPLSVVKGWAGIPIEPLWHTQRYRCLSPWRSLWVPRQKEILSARFKQAR